VAVVLYVIAVVLVVIGLAGVVLPALPGAMLIVAGLVLAAWVDGFTRVGTWPLIAIAILGVGSYGIDFVATALGAKKLGASTRAMVGAGVGTLLGLFAGIPGLIVGPFLGAVIGELTVNRDVVKAGQAGVAAWIGFLVGTALKVAVAFLMIAIFLAAMFF
jgi:uncharacterized protein